MQERACEKFRHCLHTSFIQRLSGQQSYEVLVGVVGSDLRLLVSVIGSWSLNPFAFLCCEGEKREKGKGGEADLGQRVV